MTIEKATSAPSENQTLKCVGVTQPLRVLGLASKSIHLNFGLIWGQVITCCFKCRRTLGNASLIMRPVPGKERI